MRKERQEVRPARPGVRFIWLNEALTAAECGYDYAGQDPINGYDLSGLMAAETEYGGYLGEPAVVREARNGETNATRNGRDAHKALKVELGSKYDYEVDTGKGRADAVNFETHEIVELKPNNPRAIRLGMQQLVRYERGLYEKYGFHFHLTLLVYGSVKGP